jgi:DNA-binding NtrC family response regulator
MRERGEAAPSALPQERLRALLHRPWPGNVRELRNAVERACFGLLDTVPGVPPLAEPGAFIPQRDRVLLEFERRYLACVLERTGGNVSEASRRAGMHRRDFQRLISAHHLGQEAA